VTLDPATDPATDSATDPDVDPAPAAPVGAPAAHIVLVGLMGAGKTSVGKRLAKRLGRPFVDADDELERVSGRTVAQIFATEGEAGFRAREGEVLADLLARADPYVIATGGGVVTRPENRVLLARSGARVVWLAARPETVLERLRCSPTVRPLLADDPEATVRRLAVEREPWYREVAGVCVCVDGRSVADVVDAVLR
jgi:shikimate kinase